MNVLWKIMNQKMAFKCIFLVICIVIGSACHRTLDVFDDDFKRYTKFLVESTAFDYCGYSYSSEDVGIAIRGYHRGEILYRYKFEPDGGNRSFAFFELVKALEAQVMEKGSTVHWDIVDGVRNVLMDMRRTITALNKGVSYEHNLVRLLYSVARVVEGTPDSRAFKTAFVSRILPDCLFATESSDAGFVFRMSCLKAFRDMLLVSCYVGRSCVNNNWQMDAEDNRLRDFWTSQNFCFKDMGNIWVMIWDNRKRGDRERFSTDGFPFPQIAGEERVFLTPDYSKRRKVLFRNGESRDGKFVWVYGGKIAIADRVHQFYLECLSFDYCGTNGVVNSARGMFEEERVEWNVRMRPNVIERERAFYEALRQFEVVAAWRQPIEECAEVARRLLLLRNESIRLHYVSSVEYSLLRVLDSNVQALRLQDIDRILPDDLYEETFQDRFFGRIPIHKAFKNMIGIAHAIGIWKKTHGTPPSSLDDLNLEPRWLEGIRGAKIEYKVVGGIWQLFSPGSPGGKDRSRFNEYVPIMDAPGIRFWPQSACLWLSVDYSAKRRYLYETGTLYVAGMAYACRLNRGRVL